VTALLLAAVSGTGMEASVAATADELVAVVLAGEHLMTNHKHNKSHKSPGRGGQANQEKRRLEAARKK